MISFSQTQIKKKNIIKCFKKKMKDVKITFARVGKNKMEAGHVSKCQSL